jgi:hypothetical protein
MCKPYRHIIIVQIIIDNAKFYSIIVYKHEMDLKLYAFIQGWKVHWKNIFLNVFFTEIQFEYKSKYIAQAICNKTFPLPKQKLITNMMNHNNQMVVIEKICFHKLIFFLFVEMELKS